VLSKKQTLDFLLSGWKKRCGGILVLACVQDRVGRPAAPSGRLMMKPKLLMFTGLVIVAVAFQGCAGRQFVMSQVFDESATDQSTSQEKTVVDPMVK